MSNPFDETGLADSVCRGLIMAAMHAFDRPEETDRPGREHGRKLVDIIIAAAREGGFTKGDELLLELQAESSILRPPMALINEAVAHIARTNLALILGKIRRSDWS